MISRLVVGVALLFAILLFTLPKTDEESIARIASASMLMCSADFRERVAQQVMADGAVTAQFDNRCPGQIASLAVEESGRLVITGKEHRLTMTLTPVVEGGKVRWSCRGEPPEAVARLCKP